MSGQNVIDIRYLPRQKPRSFEVLVLASLGYTNREIGEKLHKSPQVVKNQLYDLYRIYEAKNKAHLIRIACEAGIL
jgi:DNA-binding CsgD family transcriptional regulator